MKAMLDGMLLTACAIVVGALMGLIRGGSLRAVLGSPLRYWPVLLTGAAFHTIAEQADVPFRLSVFVIGSFLLVVSALANVHLKGAVVSGIGMSLNLAAVVANGHVPIRLDALIAAGEVEPGTQASQVTIEGGLWKLEDADTRLRQLGDIVPLPFFDDVVSFGDLILIGGLTVLTMNLVLHRRRVGVEIDDLLADDSEVDIRDIVDLEVPAMDPSDAPAHTNS